MAFAHLNVCRSLNKLDYLSVLLRKSDLDILCVTETSLNTDISDAELNIPGYNFIRSDRHGVDSKKSGGGLLIYYSDMYDVTEVESYCSADIELFFASLVLPKSRPILLSCFYHPLSGNIAKGLEESESKLTDLSNLANHKYLPYRSMKFAEDRTAWGDEHFVSSAIVLLPRPIKGTQGKI